MDNIWLVVKIKNNSENKAYLNLKNQGFEVFYPRIYIKTRYCKIV